MQHDYQRMGILKRLEEIKKNRKNRVFRYEAIVPTPKESFIYIMEDLKTGLVKIGKSNSPEERMKTLNRGLGGSLRIVNAFWFPSEAQAFAFEVEAHTYYGNKRTCHPIHADGSTEFFSIPVNECHQTLRELYQNSY